MTPLILKIDTGINYVQQHGHIRNLMSSAGYHQDTFDIIYLFHGYVGHRGYDYYRLWLDAELTEQQLTWLRLKLADNLMEDPDDTHS